jgi:hypothetical protein
MPSVPTVYKVQSMNQIIAVLVTTFLVFARIVQLALQIRQIFVAFSLERKLAAKEFIFLSQRLWELYSQLLQDDLTQQLLKTPKLSQTVQLLG